MDVRMETPPWPVLSEEAISKLASGVHSTIGRWTALQLAVENQWGGRGFNQKVAQLENDVVGWFVHSKARRYIDELEDLLDDVMIEQFKVEADDNSIPEVAEQIFVLHEECSQGNYETVHSLAAAALSQSKPASAKSVKAPNENGEESDSDDDSMDEEGQGIPSSSGQQDMSMELEPSSAQGSKATRQEAKAPTLTEEEMADGWQEAPTRSRRRGGKRT